MIVESIEDHLIVAGNRERMQVYEWLEVICSRPWMGAYLRRCFEVDQCFWNCGQVISLSL